MKETRFGYREMTSQEYEKALNFYRSQIEVYLSSSGRLNREYGKYLERWFSDESCDGAANYEMRYRFHRLPMAANTYMFE
jgi:hypothetical protein